jgi:hypothetical protein
MKTTLVFAYNADSGVFNALTDLAHKTFSPQTYPCNLCAITHSTFGMRKEWKQFLEGLEVEKEFLHADELKRRYGIEAAGLPAVFKKRRGGLELYIDAAAINGCKTITDLKGLIVDRLTSDASARNTDTES